MKAIAQAIEMSRRSVIRHIAALEKQGLLSKETRRTDTEFLTNVYFLAMRSGDNLTPPSDRAGTLSGDRAMSLKPSYKKPSKKNYSLPSDLQSLETDWSDWLQHRREIGKRMTPKTFEKQVKQLRGWGVEKSRQVIERAIASGWQGLFDSRDERSTLQLNGLSYGKLIEMSRERRDKLNALDRTYGDKAPGAVGKQRKRLLAEMQQLKQAITTERNKQ
jgi:biotin operon repressor